MELLIRARNSVGRVPMKALYGDENEKKNIKSFTMHTETRNYLYIEQEDILLR